jgi:chemotaxis methyl-accepting protein methylase
MDDAEFHQVLALFNLSRQGYRKVRKGVKKRLLRHMRQLECRNAAEYLAAVRENDSVRRACRMHLTVSISRFFRDRSLWDRLADTILPPLLSAHAGPFRVWSCGCARGEEVYSFRILWERLRPAFEKLPELSLWGTDMNPGYLDMARRGVYALSSLKELHHDAVAHCFDKVPGKQLYAVKSVFKDGVRFERHDIVNDPPPAPGFELVFLRNNLLTYYRFPEKQTALAAILHALCPGGALIVGSHERLPEDFGWMQAAADHPWIFFKPRST